MDEIIKLSKFIEALQITMNKVGDLDVLIGIEQMLDGKHIMKYDIPDFITLDGECLVVTGMKTVDSILARQEQVKVEQTKFVDENGNILG